MFGPNSTGRLIARPHQADESYGAVGYGNGVFSTGIKNSTAPFSPIDVSTGEMMGDLVNFSLASGNSIYRGSSVQPKALQVLPCIRY